MNEFPVKKLQKVDELFDFDIEDLQTCLDGMDK